MQGLLRLGLGRSLTAGQVSVTGCMRVPHFRYIHWAADKQVCCACAGLHTAVCQSFCEWGTGGRAIVTS